MGATSENEGTRAVVVSAWSSWEENDPADEESAEARSGNVSASVEAVEGVSELTVLSPRRERSKM
jgi:hypothetical protein